MSKKVLSNKEIKKWMLENCVDSDGDLVLGNLDFSDFDGDIYMSDWKVKRNLYQSYHEVGGNLYQRYHEVGGNLEQTCHKVDGNLTEGYHRVGGRSLQNRNKVKKEKENE